MGKEKRAYTDAAIRRACAESSGPLADQILKILDMGEQGISKAIFVSNPNDERHGTPTGYGYGCRCDKCGKAHTKIAKKNREAFKENPDDKRHGTTTGYNYGCRCVLCKEAYEKKRGEA